MTKRSKTHDRDLALNRALALFWKQGYHATSLKDLEAALGMHPGSIYAAFGSKERLFRLALERYGEALFAERAAIAEDTPGILDGLARFIEEVHPVARDDGPVPACFLAKTALDTGIEAPEIRGALSNLLDAAEFGFVETFRAAQEAGEITRSADPQTLARRLHVALAGLSFYALRPNQQAAAQQMAHELARDIRGLQQAQSAPGGWLG